MRFDPIVDGDEDLAAAAREDLVARFGRWLETRPAHRSADPSDADLLLQWKWAYGDGDYGSWVRSEVDEVLLDHLPRKLSATPEDAATIPGSLAAFVRFLDEEGLLDPASDPADALEARALAQQRAFLDAMADPRNFGMAKSLFGSFGFADGDGIPDAAELDVAVAGFNALPFDERGRILGLDDGAPVDPDVELPLLPLRDMPSTDEIEALAPDVPLLRQVDAFHQAVGGAGVRLTKAGNLSLADARRMLAATGIDDRMEGVRSSADLPGLFAAGSLAMQAGATQVVGDRLANVDTWEKLPGAERWQRVVDAAYELGVASLTFGATTPSPLQLADFADGVAMHLLAMLWIVDGPLPVDALREVLVAGAQADGTGMRLIDAVGRDHFDSICAARCDDVQRTLEALGITTDGENGRVALTRAGARLSAPTLKELGFGVVVPDEVVGLDTEGLLDLLMAHGGAEVEAFHSLWTADRDATDAAHELVAALTARPEPLRLMVGFSILELFGASAVDALQAALDGPVAGHAWLLLATIGAVAQEDVPRDVVTSVAIDTFLATADDGAPADVVELVLGAIPAGEHGDFLAELATSDHERTGELLELLARHHPDAEVGRQARKAAHRWRSRQGRPIPARSFSGARENVPTIQPRGRRERGGSRKGGRRRPR